MYILFSDGASCAFFCRMKCPKFKMAMCAAKSPGYKVSVYTKCYCTVPLKDNVTLARCLLSVAFESIKQLM